MKIGRRILCDDNIPCNYDNADPSSCNYDCNCDACCKFLYDEIPKFIHEYYVDICFKLTVEYLKLICMLLALCLSHVFYICIIEYIFNVLNCCVCVVKDASTDLFNYFKEELVKRNKDKE